MAIVPLVKDVSIKTIREVINQKAIVLGQLRYRGVSYDLYGQDKQNGQIEVVLENIQSSGSVTVVVSITQNGTTYAVEQSFTLTPGQKITKKYINLPGKFIANGNYNKERYTGGKPSSQYTGNYNYSVTITETGGQSRSDSATGLNLGTSGNEYRYNHALAIFQAYPLEKISMRDDNGDITSNYELREGVQIPTPLIQTPSKLSNWRGAQVIHGTVLTRSTRKGRYGSDTGVGFIHVYLDPRGFSDGPVTVTIANVKSITRNISTTNNKTYKFNTLARGTYTVVIKDELTGVTAYKKFTVSSSSYGGSLRHKSISFNGDSEMVAFNF